jgi:hypothetical protein
MRDQAKAAVKFMERATSQLENMGSATVRESLALLQGMQALQKQIMLSGARARESLRRQDEEMSGKGLGH